MGPIKVGRDGLLTKRGQEKFRYMLSKYGNAFDFDITKIGCVDPQIEIPMVIFTLPHIPWDLNPIPVPKAVLQKVIDLLKEKLEANMLERLKAPHSNRWFTIRKGMESFDLFQDMQPSNRIIITNVGIGPNIYEFAGDFIGRSIYSIGDLYSDMISFNLLRKVGI